VCCLLYLAEFDLASEFDAAEQDRVSAFATTYNSKSLTPKEIV
jgi:hypothetical protein